jgi:hypothetical protein
MILCNYYRAWILGNSIMALIFATFSPKGTQDIKLIANINEPFPTGAKQRDQTDCGNLPSHYIEISRRKKQSTQVSMIQRWVGGSFLEARLSSVDYDFGSDLYTDSCLKLNSGSGILHSTPPSATQERQHDNPSLEDSHASQSHVLESYIHPEMTEVGTLPSLGTMRITCVGNIPIFYGLLELLGYDWILNLLHYLNFWKKSDTHNSSRPTNNCWMPDAVNFLLLTSSMRYPESQRSINLSEGASGISCSWHLACFACFMLDAGNIPPLEGCLNLSESQKNFGNSFNGPISPATQARQPDSPLREARHASQSYVLEPYFHPEFTEVGT